MNRAENFKIELEKSLSLLSKDEWSVTNVRGNFVTHKFINSGGDVAGWVSRSVINNIIYQLER